MSNKVKAAIIGPGNIGTDLLMKAMRSKVIEPVWMVGVEPESPGLARAAKMGLKTTAEGVDGMLRVNDLFRPSARHDIYLRRGDGVRQVSVEGSPLLFVRQIEDLIAAALDGRAPAVSLQESRGNAAALAALYRSARDGQPVQL